MSITTIQGDDRRSSWNQASFLHALGVGKHVISTLSQKDEKDMTLVNCVDKIPYHSWGGALPSDTIRLLQGLPSTNISTIGAICISLIQQGEGYWNDNRDRDFIGIMKAIEKRITELGYIITDSATRHYMSNASKKRISIPSRIEKK